MLATCERKLRLAVERDCFRGRTENIRKYKMLFDDCQAGMRVIITHKPDNLTTRGLIFFVCHVTFKIFVLADSGRWQAVDAARLTRLSVVKSAGHISNEIY